MPRRILDLRYDLVFERMGQHARALLDAGYQAEADQVLDEMIALRDEYEDG